MRRRNFLKSIAGFSVLGLLTLSLAAGEKRPPNILFVFADQWRAQAVGYAGDPNLQGKTPHLDRLARESVNLSNAVSTMPVCTPYRASLLTGQTALTHGLFLNDAPLNPAANSIAKVYKAAGYDTAYVGKWHVDGHGRKSYIPKERRQGFDYWKVLECTHRYNDSAYYEGNDPTLKKWESYDAIAQTRDIQHYVSDHAQSGKPFVAFLSWGSPHGPYNTAPRECRELFDPQTVQLRSNVPTEAAKKARKELAGYYAHIAALDRCMGDLLATLDENGLRENTILVFTSDHGDMLGSHGQRKKQRPFDESVRVPFLVRYPSRCSAREIDMPIGTPDIMPTLLGLSGIKVPESVEGRDYSRVLTGEAAPDNDAELIECISPFGQWKRKQGGREYRGIRTRRHTYVRSLDGPWLLFDNRKDPYQQKNLIGSPEAAPVQEKLEAMLAAKLKALGDEFRPGEEYIKQWGYTVDDSGTIRY